MAWSISTYTRAFFRAKNKITRNEKRKRLGFSYSKSMTNFKAFHWNISLSANLLFLKSECSERIKDNFHVCKSKIHQNVHTFWHFWATFANKSTINRSKKNRSQKDVKIAKRSIKYLLKKFSISTFYSKQKQRISKCI